nr:retrovirus-related Pol polyprotein from transposon TNT 1-94 [Tanacetum cinerariifolium]
MRRQCTQPKRPRNSAWFKEKMLLVEAHKSGQTDDIDASDSDCYDISSAKAVLMANLSSYDLDILFEIICQDVMNIATHADFIPINVLPTNNKCLVNDNLEFEKLEQENDHILELLSSQDIVYICVNSLATRTDYHEMQQSFIDAYNETLELKTQLAKKAHRVEKIVFNELVLRCSHLENRDPMFPLLHLLLVSILGGPNHPLAEAVVIACYTKNQSLIYKRHNKKKPDLSYLHVFGALCYPTNDSEDLGKLKPKADTGIFVGYAPTKKAYQIYKKRTRLIIKSNWCKGFVH